MINIQDGFESSHLVDNVLVEAVKRNLELKCLFDSKICTQAVTRENFKNFDQFPEFHENDKTVAGVFPGSWFELFHHKRVIEESLGEGFTYKTAAVIKNGGQEESNGICCSATDRPIKYVIDGYLMSCPNREKQAQELVVALADTENVNVFTAGYIQRFIDQQWHGAYKWFLWLNLILFSVCYGLLLANISMIDYQKGTD